MLELHGWGGLQDELNAMSKQGKWVEMGEPHRRRDPEHLRGRRRTRAVAPELHRRYGDVIQRICFYAPYKSDPDRWKQVLADVKAS